MPLNHIRLKTLRKRCRLTQVALAEKAGISEQYLVRLEKAKNPANPSIGVVGRLAAALGTTAAKLTEEPKP